LLFFHC